jgi:acyl-CoA thioesterase-1
MEAQMSAAVRNLLGPTGGRLSPIGIVHGVAARYARLELGAADVADGSLRQWCNGVATVRAQARSFADYWRGHNQQALVASGPLWVVLGDSTAQGLGASTPLDGYVGQAHAELVRRTGLAWRVVNLSRSGAVTSDVLARQLPRIGELPAVADLVTCGVGSNDILSTPPRRLHATLRRLIASLPDGAVVIDLPLPDRFWAVGGMLTPYVARVNRTIHAAAGARGLPVAHLSRHFTPPWQGKYAADRFHPSDLGYRD